MGANGSRARGGRLLQITENGRKWRVVEAYPGNIKIIEMADKNPTLKVPTKSDTPYATYVMFQKGGKGIKSISKYDRNCEKEYEIHLPFPYRAGDFQFQDHHGLGTHYHNWKDGHPQEATPLTKEKENTVIHIKKLIL